VQRLELLPEVSGKIDGFGFFWIDGFDGRAFRVHALKPGT
jgi:hypothetical protein